MDPKLKLKKTKNPQPIDDKITKSNKENDQPMTLKLLNNIDDDTKNLCFVNASLQLLHSITEIRNYFKNLEYKLEYNMPVCM